MLLIFMLTVILLCAVYAEYLCYAECRYVLVIMRIDIIPSANMLSTVRLSVIRLDVVLLQSIVLSAVIQSI